MSVYVQIGSGVGDLDHSADFRDGFSKFVKSQRLTNADRIILVEANEHNIPTLQLSWKDHPQAEVHHLAVTAKPTLTNQMELFYSPKDGPFFQVSSFYREHVLKFYNDCDIESKFVPSLWVNDFLRQTCGNSEIELLALDIEGLDAPLLLSLDFTRFKIHKVSFEKSHIESEYFHVARRLQTFGYVAAGMGMDPHNSDVLWVKPKTHIERLSCFTSYWKHKMWEVQIPIRHWVKLKFLNS